MSHLGTVSSFEVRPDRPEWPRCYESMSAVWSLQSYERFAKRCKYTDLSPCQFSVSRACQSSCTAGLLLHPPCKVQGAIFLKADTWAVGMPAVTVAKR